jgi:hypothetical protein
MVAELADAEDRMTMTALCAGDWRMVRCRTEPVGAGLLMRFWLLAHRHRRHHAAVLVVVLRSAPDEPGEWEPLAPGCCYVFDATPLRALQVFWDHVTYTLTGARALRERHGLWE